MSEADEVSPDDTVGVAEGIRRAARGSVVHLVQDGRAAADIVPATSHQTSQRDTARPDDAELDSTALAQLALAQLEERMPTSRRNARQLARITPLCSGLRPSPTTARCAPRPGRRGRAMLSSVGTTWWRNRPERSTSG